VECLGFGQEEEEEEGEVTEGNLVSKASMSGERGEGGRQGKGVVRSKQEWSEGRKVWDFYEDVRKGLEEEQVGKGWKETGLGKILHQC